MEENKIIMTMNHKGLILTTIAFFLYVNTKNYWIGKIGLFSFPTIMLSAIILLGLIVALFGQIYFATKEKFAVRPRLFIIGLLTVVLLITFYKPTGLIYLGH